MTPTFQIALLCACAVTSYASFFCKNFDDLNDSNSREVYVSARSDVCGTPVEEVEIKQDCLMGSSSRKVINFSKVTKGLYKYRAPRDGHDIELKCNGFRSRSKEIKSDRNTNSVTMECEGDACTRNNVEVTVLPVCGQDTAPEVVVVSPNALSVTEAEGVFTVTSCPSCTPDLTLVTGGRDYTFPSTPGKYYTKCPDGSSELWIEIVQV